MKKFTLKNKKRLLMLMGLSVATGIGVIATAAACTPEKKPSKKTTVTAETSAFENHKEKETMSKEDVENEMRERDKTPDSNTYVPPKSPEESSAKPKSEGTPNSETSKPSPTNTKPGSANESGSKPKETETSPVASGTDENDIAYNPPKKPPRESEGSNSESSTEEPSSPESPSGTSGATSSENRTESGTPESSTSPGTSPSSPGA